MVVRSRDILVAVDSSEFSEEALKYASQKILTSADHLTIAHVRPVVEEKDFFAAEPYRKEFEEAYLKDSKKLLQKLEEVALSLAPPGIQVRGVSLAGDPSEEIVKLAQDLKPVLLIVGSHGKGMIARALLGSVSKYLVHSSPCPVLVVKPASK